MGEMQTFLQSINDIVNHDLVKNHLSTLINHQWTYDNVLKIIDNQQGVMTLIQYLVLLLFLINPHVKYLQDVHQQVILKLMLYLFYVLIPNQGIIYTIDERQNILYYCMNIYNNLNQTDIIFYSFEDLEQMLSKTTLIKKYHQLICKKIHILQQYLHLLIK
jgi:hypothetical protein